MKYSTVIFDLDGTLWDSSANVINSWNECIARNTDLGIVITQEQMQGYMGKTMEQIAALLFPMLPEEEQIRLLRLCTAEENEYLKEHGSAYYPKEKETLEKLAEKYTLAVVSNCQDGYIQIFLSQCGFGELFSDFESAGKTGLDKSGNIRLVAERNGLDSVIYVGDTVMDGEAARKAGVRFVHAAYGFGSPDDYDARITEISQLTDAAEKIF